jgi:hypothetical protein
MKNVIKISVLHDRAKALGYVNAHNHAYELIINKWPSTLNVSGLAASVVRKALKNGADLESIINEGL